MTARRGRRLKQILDGIKERREYCKLKEVALDHCSGALVDVVDMSR